MSESVSQCVREGERAKDNLGGGREHTHTHIPYSPTRVHSVGVLTDSGRD